MPPPPDENPPGERLAPGCLWRRVAEVSDRALASGALEPIATRIGWLADGGVRFMLRSLSSLRRKPAARRLEAAAGRERNPFLPWDPGLYVGDLTATHAALLNRYNVVERHVLIVTRAYEDQQILPGRADLEAAWVCLREAEGLVFHNGGPAAGASQPHKHLQLVPLPLADRGPALPVEPLLEQARFSGRLGRCPGLPFRHALASSAGLARRAEVDPAAAADGSLELFEELLEAVGLGGCGPQRRQVGPFNLLLTRRWMLVVPRSAERIGGVSINALGYAGSLLVRGRAEVALLRRIGPLRALAEVGLAG